ncbi:beta strand repeat-containing protein [Opitutus terrae]|uniref:Autotransporter-associated beta strand repeat protein n=1 Tax=Opitutus terrae (strain DSM 11246 / JCM 15787 / PB90-1) TaxID=452637 RepID=B1ZVS0_OPITP|nr:autotransporter-associated beta strand repeat-containing protein [Opitutus terrae]ACB75006.1 autotransporter-associated beta strand repeat protein [Opitutus terrae PB90-1]
MPRFPSLPLAVFLVLAPACLATDVELFNGDDVAQSVTITAGDTLYFRVASGSANNDGSISGEGSFVKWGLGQLILGGPLTYTGSTAVSAGTLTLQYPNTPAIPGSSLTISSGATFELYLAADFTYANLLHGEGTFTKFSNTTLTLTADNLFQGTFALTNGTLQIGNGGTSGGLYGTIVNDSALIFNRSNDTTFTGSITGAGTTTKLGAGTLTFTGDSTATGTFTVSAGNLQVGNGGTSGSLGSAPVDLAASTGLLFNRSDASTYGGPITGSGTLTKLGAGTLTLTGDSTNTGAITLSEGTLQLGAGGTSGALGSGAATLASGTTLAVNRSDTLVLASALSGSGGFSQTGTGTTILTANNTATGTTTISAGTLQVGNDGTTGSLGAGNTTNNATLRFARTDTYNYGGTISGTGAIVQAGTGTTILTANNTATGTTTISAGTLQLGDGSASSGSVGGAIVNDAALVFNRTNVTSFNQVISGSGSVTKAGSGNLSLGGANSYTGGTILAAGALELGHADALGSAGTLTFSGGVLRFTSANTTDYSARFASSGSYRLDTNGQAVTLASALNANSLVKFGAGTLTLTGSNSYGSTSTVNQGTLAIGDGGTTGSWSGTVTVGAGATLAFNRSDDFAFANTLANAGTVTKSGAGTLQFTGSLSGTGNLTISAGTFEAQTGSSVAHAITNNGALVFNRSDSVMLTSAISGSGTFTKSGTGTLTLATNNNASGATTISGGTLRIGAGGTAGYVLGNIANDAALIFNRSDATSYDGILSGAGSVTKLGAGTLTLTGANTSTGTTTLSAGTLELGSASALGSSGTITFSGGTLRFGTVSPTDYSSRFSSAAGQVFRLDTGSRDATLASALASTGGSLEKSGSGSLILTANNTYTGTTTVSAGTLQLGANSAAGSVAGNISLASGTGLLLYRSSDLTYGGVISGAGSVTRTGGGATIFTADHTYTGGTTIINGTLQLGNGSTSGSVTGDIANAGSVVFNRSNNTTYAGVISGNGSVTKQGAGTLTLTSAHTFTGTTTISAGTLTLNGAGALMGNIVNNAALTFSPSGSRTYAGNLSGTGAVTLNGASTQIFTGAASHTGGTTVQAGTLQLGNGGTSGALAGNVTLSTSLATLAFNRSDAVTFSGAVSGSGALTQSGSGTLTLSGVNTYTGGTTLAAGTLELGSADALGSSGIINFTGGTLRFTAANTTDYSNRFNSAYAVHQDYRVDTNGRDVTFASGFGDYDGNSTFTKLGSGTLTLTSYTGYTGATTISAGTLQLGDGTSTGAVSGAIVNQAALVINTPDSVSLGAISGSGTLTKLGAGTVYVYGENTSTGAVTISAGSFLVNNSSGSGTGSGDVTVQSGALLGGDGTVGGLTTLAAGAILAPGNSPGTLTFTNGLTLNAGAVFNFELGAAASDLIRITGGTLTGPASGTVTLNLFDAGDFTAASYTLFDFSTGGTTLSDFDLSDFSFGSTLAGYSYSLAFVGSTLELTASAIPEPSTYAALCGLAAFGLAFYKRRARIAPLRSVPPFPSSIPQEVTGLR